MWNSWAEQARKGLSEATEKAAEALEKTGDALTKAAANPHSRQVQRPKPVDVMTPRNLESVPADESPANQSLGSNPSPTDIRARAAAALAKVDAKQQQRESKANSSSSSGRNIGMGSPKLHMPPMNMPQLNMPNMNMKKNLQSPVFQNISKGWNNVVDSAKKGVAAAQEAIDKEQSRLELLMQQRDQPKYYSRDLSLPLDVPALKDAEVVYVTDRIISMSHPALPSSQDPRGIPGDRKLAAVAHLLEKRHGRGNVMIWNLSEVTTYHQHAAAVLERVGPVLAFSFPGSPAPPLGLWLQLLLSLEKWLQASPDNVAVVHCLTGKGRTSTVLAAFLCWMAEAGFENTNMTSALQYIAQCKKLSVNELTIPSQRRYAQYFTNMLEGIRPSQPPLVLKRIIMSEAPHFALGPPLTNKNKDDNDSKPNADNKSNDKKDGGSEQEGENRDRMGCAPYLQVFQAGQLLHTVAATLHFQQQPEALPFCQVADGSIAFHVDQVIQGDVLIRCRHLAHSTRQKISMFRAAFHTGYAPPNVLRFTKVQLDGACNDPRFPEDFFVDLIFEPCTNEQAAEFYQQQEVEIQQKEKEAAESNEHVEKDAVVSASTYDSMLHRDSRFWDVISDHLKTNNGDGSKVDGDDGGEDDKDKAAGDGEENADKEKDKSKMWGPTVGKRRVFTSPPKTDESDGKTDGGATGQAPAQAPLQTFSIGGELDFLPEPEKASAARPKQPPKKDTLMEALMGALELDDHEEEPAHTEEIVFDDGTPAFAPEPAPAPPQPTIVALPPLPASAPAPAEGDPTPADAAADSSAPAAESPKESEAPSESSVSEGEIAADATKVPPPQHQDSATTTQSMKEMEEVLGTGDDDLDMDMDALLADDGDDDFNLDDYDVDAEDAELEDLENFLNAK